MERKLEWLSDEEGRIIFFEEDKPFLTAEFFLTGEDEAEFKVQNVMSEEETIGENLLSEKMVVKVTECLLECFQLLWNEELEEVVFVEQRGTKIEELLNSADVLQKIYSEYMMKRHLEPQNVSEDKVNFLELTKTEDGYICENKEKSFFCRLLSYEAEAVGEQSFYLYEVEVKKKSRNKGIATKCLTGLFSLLSQKAPLTIYLQVGSYNEPAVHLYKKLGFDVSEELGYYIPAQMQ